jgi:hypothetical protein
MHDTLTPNVLKVEFSRKVIQIRALVALGKSETRKDPNKNYQLFLATNAGMITGDYCELYCSDDFCCSQKGSELDFSEIDELANKVLIDAEDELVNIKLVDNAEFIKLVNASIKIGSELIEMPQLLVYADQITAFSLIKK